VKTSDITKITVLKYTNKYSIN